MNLSKIMDESGLGNQMNGVDNEGMGDFEDQEEEELALDTQGEDDDYYDELEERAENEFGVTHITSIRENMSPEQFKDWLEEYDTMDSNEEDEEEDVIYDDYGEEVDA